jgi:hypothetical protein
MLDRAVDFYANVLPASPEIYAEAKHGKAA